MIKKFIRSLQPNPFDCTLKKAKRKNLKNFLFAWNRGLGDIALGLYGLIHKTKKVIPDSKITFLIRENLKEGFQLLSDIFQTNVQTPLSIYPPYNGQGF